ncbi:MAG: NAD-dependent epimerase/dehydratase family protein [Bryobacteraceae bacterium]
MSILVTGATGYIGSAVAERLRARGHAVAGLARSDEAAHKLEAAGVAVVRGSLEDPAAFASAAAASDGVIHTALARGPQAGALDKALVEATLGVLAGSNRPFVYTSGCWVMGNTGGRLAGEMFPIKPPALVAWRPAVERLVLDATERKVRGIVLRPCIVWGRGSGLLAHLIHGRLPVAGDGSNHWSFIHIDELAEVYALAFERAPAGSLYVVAHGPAIPVKQLAEAAGISTSLPLDQAREKLGPLADALALDQKIGSTKAARELGWLPSPRSILEEIRRGSL